MQNMRTRLTASVWGLIVIIGVTVLGGCAEDPGEERAFEGGKAPNVALRGAAGNLWKIGDFPGKVVAVHFWATWCPPCRPELPELERVYRDFKERPFQLLPILYEDDVALGTQFLNSQGLTMPLLTDPSKTAAMRFGVTGVPETYLIDKKGIVRKSFIGPVSWDDPGTRAFLETLLNE